MVEKEETKKLSPPYLPYKTLRNFLESMKVAMPARIDRSVMRSMSGAMQSQLILALKYLHLISLDAGVPTEKLTKLVHSEGAERQRILKEILISSYSFLFKEGFNLEDATPLQLQERFAQSGVSGNTMRKCIAFFMRATKDAGITLHHITKGTPGPRPGTTKEKRKTNQFQQTLDANPKDFIGSQGQNISLDQLLLSKFPSFDPAWPDEVKAKWFEGFNKLMEQFKKE